MISFQNESLDSCLTKLESDEEADGPSASDYDRVMCVCCHD